MANLGGDLIIGGQPLDDYLRPLSGRLASPDDTQKLLGLLASYEAGISLTADETAFVFDKAKEIALSFF